MIRRREFAGLLLAQAGCLRSPRKPGLARAVDYLWKQQASDGGWHSRTYGLLRSGQSLTPFVLDALLSVPERVYDLPRARVTRAVAFILTQTQANGCLGVADRELPDYPNYATALAVSALSKANSPGAHAEQERMTAYLRGQQFTEQNGWPSTHAVYGAWGMGGERRTPPHTGHVDLSMTRYVLEALRASGVPPSDEVFARALIFLQRCQNPDGGFFFSTTEYDTNKAGHDGKQFRSYGTTTADGILALLAAGKRPQDPPVISAREWLVRNHRSMAVPGFIGDAYKRWPHGLAFYYAAASTDAFRALGADAGAAVREELERTQRADGSWTNQENLVKEDDPLIATAFAIRALL